MGRFEDESPHRRIIPRRFAIAAQEVTVEEYRVFVKQNSATNQVSNDRNSPDPTGPMNNRSWYDAAAYCNWLSRQEGLPECYEPNGRGEYATGMKIKADALRLEGYRLPTEAEWEYACQAGAGTSRPYGASLELLGRSAWYNATSQDRAWPCGSLQPNELGLFDMLGNVYEWCQDVYRFYQPDCSGKRNYDIDIFLVLDSESPRILRGGSFNSRPAIVRSANRNMNAPAYSFAHNGFRPARTYH
jgi:formylglycine-generating enzyme required for sulfatase activity